MEAVDRFFGLTALFDLHTSGGQSVYAGGDTVTRMLARTIPVELEIAAITS